MQTTDQVGLPLNTDPSESVTNIATISAIGYGFVRPHRDESLGRLVAHGQFVPGIGVFLPP